MFEENREQDERNASNQIRFRIKEKEEIKQTKKKKKTPSSMKTSNYRIFEQSELRTKEWSYIIIRKQPRRSTRGSERTVRRRRRIIYRKINVAPNRAMAVLDLSNDLNGDRKEIRALQS